MRNGLVLHVNLASAFSHLSPSVSGAALSGLGSGDTADNDHEGEGTEGGGCHVSFENLRGSLVKRRCRLRYEDSHTSK